MGYIKHHAIVVTSWNEKSIIAAQNEAQKIFGTEQVSSLVKGVVNSYMSFFIGPDGSKEGWPEDEDGDEKRTLFIDWIKQWDYEDGSNSLRYAELFYGDDKNQSKVERHN